MTTPDPVPQDPWALSTGGPPPGAAPSGQPQHGQPPYGQPQYGQPQQYGGQPYGGQPYGLGPPGEVRATGRCVLLAVVTLSVYVYVYNYRVHAELQRHSGRGVGGGIALLLTFIANIAMPFVTSSEVGSQYARRGERPPVNGWTGLWVVAPLVGGYVAFFAVLLLVSAATPTTATGSSEPAAAALALGFVAYAVVAMGGAVVWFVKTNGALNRYWQSLGVR